MNYYNNKYLIVFLSFVFIFSGSYLFTPLQASYVSNTLKGRYVHDLDKEQTYDSKLIYEVNYENTINKENIYGKIIVKPIFEYDLENKTEDIKLSEAYIDIYFNKYDLRIGKQNMTWGKSDGLVVTNIVNPRDYNVHPIIEYKDQFQSVNAIKANFYPNNNTLELVWLPEFKSAKLNRDVLLKNLPKDFIKDGSEKEVDKKFENSELFLRYSSLGQKYDYEIMAGYSWEDRPTFHKDFQRKAIIPKHHRLYTVGGSISTIWGSTVFRGEGAYISGKHFNLTNPLLYLQEYPDGTIEKDEIKWLLGLDYNYKDYLFSIQFMQEKILDYNEDLIKDEDQNTITLLIKRDFLRSRLNTEINFHYNINEEVLMAKPSVSYDYNNSINFKLGAKLNLEGETFRTDVIYLQTEYLF